MTNRPTLLSFLSFISFFLPHPLLPSLCLGAGDLYTSLSHRVPLPTGALSGYCLDTCNSRAFVFSLQFPYCLSMIYLLHLCDVGLVLSRLVSFISNCVSEFIFMMPCAEQCHP